jgi:hypothetical protein
VTSAFFAERTASNLKSLFFAKERTVTSSLAPMRNNSLFILLTVFAILSSLHSQAQDRMSLSDKSEQKRAARMSDLRLGDSSGQSGDLDDKLKSLRPEKEAALKQWILERKNSDRNEKSRLKTGESSSDLMRAMGTKDGGGGTPPNIDFQSAVQEALADFKLYFPLEYAELVKSTPDRKGILETIEGATFIVIDESLSVELMEIVQDSAAYFIPELQVILINRNKWEMISKLPTKNLRKANAFHEVLGLMGLEKTGHSPISSKLLQRVSAASVQNIQPDIGEIPNSIFRCTMPIQPMMHFAAQLTFFLRPNFTKVIQSESIVNPKSGKELVTETARTFNNRPAFVKREGDTYFIQAIMHSSEGPFEREMNLVLHADSLKLGILYYDNKFIFVDCEQVF